jgi:ubiquitin-conjugating enzyme E2 Z
MSVQAKTLSSDISGRLTPLAIKRLQREQVSFAKQQDESLFVVFDDDMAAHKAIALVMGPKGSPFEGGFYFFEMSFPDEYPLKPPMLDFKTSDGRVRFHPNLYTNGKVCLSILGTWQGPSWTSACTYQSVLLSIQSIMDSHPIHHEPGYETQLGAVDATYTRMVKYENINVAVCGILEKFPSRFQDYRSRCEQRFLSDYERHIAECDSFAGLTADTAPVYHFITEYKPADLKQRLGNLRQRLLGIPANPDTKEKTAEKTEEKNAEKKAENKVEKKKAEKKVQKKDDRKTERKTDGKKDDKKEEKKSQPAGRKRVATTKTESPKKKAKK